MMKKGLPLLLFLLVFAGCGGKAPSSVVCPPPQPEKVYSYEEKLQGSGFPLGDKTCRLKELCKYKDCTKMEDPEHLCYPGREFGHRYINELKNDNLRLDYGEGMFLDLSDLALYSGVKVKITVLTGMVEVNTEAFYRRQDQCGYVVAPLNASLLSGIVLQNKKAYPPEGIIYPPYSSQKIVQAGETVLITEEEVITLQDFKDQGVRYRGFRLYVAPLAKENLIAYEIEIPKD